MRNQIVNVFLRQFNGHFYLCFAITIATPLVLKGGYTVF